MRYAAVFASLALAAWKQSRSHNGEENGQHPGVMTRALEPVAVPAPVPVPPAQPAEPYLLGLHRVACESTSKPRGRSFLLG